MLYGPSPKLFSNSSCLCSLKKELEEKEETGVRAILDLRGVKGMLDGVSHTTIISCHGWRLSKSINRRPLALWSKMSSAFTARPCVNLTISSFARSNEDAVVSTQNFEGAPSIRNAEPSLL
jgi:hypothetical protein